MLSANRKCIGACPGSLLALVTTRWTENCRYLDERAFWSIVCPLHRFSAFPGQVKKWLTINEPWSFIHHGYSTGMHAPGRCSDRRGLPAKLWRRGWCTRAYACRSISPGLKTSHRDIRHAGFCLRRTAARCFGKPCEGERRSLSYKKRCAASVATFLSVGPAHTSLVVSHPCTLRPKLILRLRADGTSKGVVQRLFTNKTETDGNDSLIAGPFATRATASPSPTSPATTSSTRTPRLCPPTELNTRRSRGA